MKGFVFGKFLPFHKGHEAMIRFAAQKCDKFTVVVCCSDKEQISASTRLKWLKDTFSEINEIKIIALDYKESDLPNTSVASKEISKVWAAKFKEMLPDAELLVTSEPYGEMVSRYMKIRHLNFDQQRVSFPVSASRIRNDLDANWHFTAEKTRKDLGILVVILGTESTGKTTLVRNLAAHFNCSFVEEAGRDLIADSTDFSFADLQKVADEHTRRIEAARTGKSRLVIADTNCLITKSYAHFSFGKELELPDEMMKDNHADLYLYLSNDVPFFQDGTRLPEEERNALESLHRKTMTDHAVIYTEISGDWQNRFLNAVKAIEEYCEEKNRNRLW